MADFRIEYDDQPHEIIEKINKVLEKRHGLKLQDIEEDDDGFVDYNIVRIV